MSHFLFTSLLLLRHSERCCRPASLTGLCHNTSWCRSEVRGQLFSSGLEKEPSCLVLTSFSCSSCLCARRYRYSMCITSVFLMRAFSLNSSRIRGMKPGLSWPARRNCRYRERTCFCSLL
uniref:Secreted protein n=1 Tax=Sparus aurata TaxID=8175 RepID=A0A671UM46_SPAAU